MPPKQKPNDACGCGSGKKHKKCCGAGGPAGGSDGGGGGGGFAVPSASSLPPPPLSADITRALDELQAADAAGDLARATRRGVTALSLAGEAWASGARAPSLVADAERSLTYLVDLQSRQGRLAAAADCHARTLALLLPPHAPFWARALTTLTHAAWRDTLLPAADGRPDVRAAVQSAVARHVCAGKLRNAHTEMGLAFSRAGGHAREAMNAYTHALEALLVFDQPGPERDVTAAGLQENIGNQLLHVGELRAAQVRYDAASALLDGAHGGDAARREGLRAHLETNRAALRSALRARPGGPTDAADDDDLTQQERTWQVCLKHRDGGLSGQWQDTEGTPAATCHAALKYVRTPAQRRTWLLRAFDLEGTCVAARGAAARRCRACAAPPPAGDKLRRCAACARVAYCGGACQRADWARHKRVCAAAAAAAAALEDATCVGCSLPLLLDGDDDEAPLMRNRQVLLLRCLHVAHQTCLLPAFGGGRAGQPCCPACPSP
jgi:hypothetical protein